MKLKWNKKSIPTTFAVYAVLSFFANSLWAQADKDLIERAKAGDTKAMCTLAFCYERGAGVPLDSVQALSWYQRASDAGDGEGALYVSRYMLEGRFIKPDTNSYYAIRKEWADKGLPNGIAGLALAYLHGLGTPVDTARYLQLVRQADSKGSSWAFGLIGDMYQNGTFGYNKDFKKAEKYFQKVVKAEDGKEGHGSLAYLYAQKGDFKKAWHHSTLAMQWNDPTAFHLQAEMYLNGSGIVVDELKAQATADRLVQLFPNNKYVYSTASRVYLYADNHRDSLRGVQYLKRGIELGDAVCMLRMSGIEAGTGNYQSALNMLTDVVEKYGDNEDKGFACGMIGEMYFQGLGVNANDDSGIVWLKRGADTYGNASCAAALARYYADNGSNNIWGVNSQAVRYYELAISQGDSDQIAELGRYYAISGDLALAQKTFQRLVDGGHPEGYYWLAALASMTNDSEKTLSMLEQGDKKDCQVCRELLGSIYEDGDGGVAIDYKKAEKYYLKAKSGKSYNNLGKMYLNGKLGKQSPKEIQKGLSYLQQAADMNYEEAIYSIGYCYETGNYVDSIDHHKALTYFRRLADAGNPYGLFKMGLYYELGDGGITADSIKCLEYYSRAADLGHGEAMCYLGDFYRIGRYLPLDRERAFHYYIMADSIGEEMGTYYVARSYLEGCGVAIDTSAAIPYLKAAAARHIGKAAYLLAQFYDAGKGTMTHNQDSAIHYYLLAHNCGSGDASYYIGKSLLEEGHENDAVQYLATAVRRGNYSAAVLYALCEMEGVGIEQNASHGYSLLEAVSQRADNPAAYYHMGVARLNGEGCQQNETLGKRYLDTAAMLGHVKALTTLAICYLNGYGCQPDTAQAISHLHKAVLAGSLDACNRLGYLYEANEDYDSAVVYYQKSMEGGNLEGYCCLGLCYEKGHGVILSHKKAYELYNTAAEHGFARGLLLLAYCYIDGINVEQDYPTALVWLLKAAEAGNTIAMYNAASLLEDGENGIKQDRKKAKQLYQQAAAQGYQPAIQALQRF